MSTTVLPGGPRRSGAVQEVLAGLAAPWALLFLTLALQIDFATMLLLPGSVLAVIIVGARRRRYRFVVAYVAGFASMLGLLALFLLQLSSAMG